MSSDFSSSGEIDTHKPFKLSNWKSFFSKLLSQISEDNVVIVSGGVAFFFFLALFPAISGIVSMYALLSNPEQIQEQLNMMASIFPADAQDFIMDRLKKVINQPRESQGWQLGGSILLSIWVANIGTRALFKGVSIAYGTDSKRNFLNENKITLLFTAGGMVFNIILIAFLVGFPALAERFGMVQFYENVAKVAQGPVLAIIISGALSLVYRFAPYKRRTKLRHTATGAITAGILWVVSSIVLSFMLRTFGIYSAPYGSTLAIVFLMLWCLLVSFVILLGAEINAVMQQKRWVKEEGE